MDIEHNTKVFHNIDLLTRASEENDDLQDAAWYCKIRKLEAMK